MHTPGTVAQQRARCLGIAAFQHFGKDLAQAILVSHLEMITAVLDSVGVPHENGFFAKDVDRHTTDKDNRSDSMDVRNVKSPLYAALGLPLYEASGVLAKMSTQTMLPLIATTTPTAFWLRSCLITLS